MPVRWNPTGQLDVATDAADLPVEVSDKIALSGAMTRCTNLDLDRKGIASTRKGSSKVNASAIDQTTISRIVEDAGVRYTFAGTKVYRNEVAITTGYTEAPWSAIIYNAYNAVNRSVFAVNGYHRRRITGTLDRDWGSASPTVAPVINPTAYYCHDTWEDDYITGSIKFPQAVTYNNKVYQAVFDWEVLMLSGDTVVEDTDAFKYMWPRESGVLGDLVDGGVYKVKYTWARKTGAGVVEWESNPSPQAATTQEGASTPIWVSWTASADSQITHVRLYRTLADGSRYYHERDVQVGNSPSFLVENDSGLGTECDWTNHDRPPLGTVVIGPNFNQICYMLKDNYLYQSLPNQPEYWPQDYYTEISTKQFPLKAACILDGQLIVASVREIYQIQGTSFISTFALPMGAQTGTVNADCFVGAKGYGIFHLGYDGIYQYTGGKDQLVSRGQFEPVFRGDTAGSMPGLNRTYINNCWMRIFKGKFYFAYPGGSDEYPKDLIVWDLASNRAVHYQYPSALRVPCVDDYNNRLLAGDNSGYIWVLENDAQTDDAGTAISWQVQTPEFNQLRKYFPRYARYDVNVGSGAVATGAVLLDDSIKQSHTLTGARLTKKRLITGCTGDRVAARISGTGSVDIYGLEIE